MFLGRPRTYIGRSGAEVRVTIHGLATQGWEGPEPGGGALYEEGGGRVWAMMSVVRCLRQWLPIKLGHRR